MTYHNVARDVKGPRVRRPDKAALDHRQAAALLGAAAGHRLAALFDFALDSAARPGEWFGLHWPDVDLEAGTAFIRQTVNERKGRLALKAPKTAKGKRRIKLARRTVAALAAHRERMRAEGHNVTAVPVFV